METDPSQTEYGRFDLLIELALMRFLCVSTVRASYDWLSVAWDESRSAPCKKCWYSI